MEEEITGGIARNLLKEKATGIVVKKFDILVTKDKLVVTPIQIKI